MLADLVALTDTQTINSNSAKEVFALLLKEPGKRPKAIVEERGMAQVSDSSAIDALADQVIAEQSKSVEDFKNGKQAALQFLVGQIMKLSRGKANPQMAAQTLRDKIAALS